MTGAGSAAQAAFRLRLRRSARGRRACPLAFQEGPVRASIINMKRGRNDAGVFGGPVFSGIPAGTSSTFYAASAEKDAGRSADGHGNWLEIPSLPVEDDDPMTAVL